MSNVNDEQMWDDCNRMIGRILTYLDEDNIRLSTKKAVKSEVWEFHNKYNEVENEYDVNSPEKLQS